MKIYLYYILLLVSAFCWGYVIYTLVNPFMSALISISYGYIGMFEKLYKDLGD